MILLNPPGDKLYIRDYYCSFSSKADYYWPPQDLIGLSGILNKDYEILVVDAIINRLTEEEVLEIVSKSEAQALIFTTGTATLQSDFRLAKTLKQKTGITLIASAGIFKFVWQDIFRKYGFLDAVLLDYAELDILSFVAGERGVPLRGLVYRKNGDFMESEDRLPLKFSLPVPRHDLFDLPKYKSPLAKNFPFAVVITSLGCPYTCAFCTAGAFGFRLRDVDNVIEELECLARLGVKELLFQDPTFTLSTKRVTEMCRKMVESGFEFTWSCNADIRSLNEDKIRAMKMAGCHTVSVGIESGDDEILKKYSKMITVDQIKAGIRLMNRYKIRILGYFIIGLPGEDRESILKTIELAKGLDLDYASFAIATPDIGTRLREEALRENWMDAEADVFDSTAYPVIVTGQLTKKDVWDLRKKAVRSFYLRPSFIWKRLRQIRSFKDVKTAVNNAISLFQKS